MNDLQKYQELFSGKWLTGEPLSKHTTLRVGGPAEYWFEPDSIDSLRAFLTHAKKESIVWRILGGGSNVLAPDEGVPGVVIYLNSKNFGKIAEKGGYVSAGAGAPLGSFLKYLLDHDYGDCVFLYGIPAQVGGAVAMNAGSSSQWIGEYLTEGRAVLEDGSLFDFDRQSAGFGYRKTSLPRCVITEAAFSFPKKDPDAVRDDLKIYQAYRQKTQDLKNPNCGCMFANPAGELSAGALIDRAGLKGSRIGGAGVSAIHGNFLMNVGGATAADVTALLDRVRSEVKRQFQIDLRTEMKVLR